MSRAEPRDIPASVRGRLLHISRESGRSFNEVLQDYAIERFLYRVYASPDADRFVLKGAAMLRVWGAHLSRPTRDIDFLGQLERSTDGVAEAVRRCLNFPVSEDGMVFNPDSVRAEEIMSEAQYTGVRCFVDALQWTARVRLHVDVGFGDAVTVGPVRRPYPQLLDFGEPMVIVYVPETAIAEKLHAMLSRGTFNSRMKDFYDVWALAGSREFDGATLATAVDATLRLRDMDSRGAGELFEALIRDPAKLEQWAAFCKKSQLSDAPSFNEAVSLVAAFVVPVLRARASGDEFVGCWQPGGLWRV